MKTKVSGERLQNWLPYYRQYASFATPGGDFAAQQPGEPQGPMQSCFSPAGGSRSSETLSAAAVTVGWPFSRSNLLPAAEISRSSDKTGVRQDRYHCAIVLFGVNVCIVSIY